MQSNHAAGRTLQPKKHRPQPHHIDKPKAPREILQTGRACASGAGHTANMCRCTLRASSGMHAQAARSRHHAYKLTAPPRTSAGALVACFASPAASSCHTSCDLPAGHLLEQGSTLHGGRGSRSRPPLWSAHDMIR